MGHNCKKLQGSKRCAVNDSCNKQLSAAFRNNEDVHVVLRNYDGEAPPSPLSDGPRAARARNAGAAAGVIKTVVAPAEGEGGAHRAAQEVQIQEACREECALLESA